MKIDPTGIAHIQLTVRNVERSRPFYYRILHEAFGMTIQYDGIRIEANFVPGRGNLDVIKDGPLTPP